MEIALLLWLLAIVLVVVGIAGLVLPALPGAPLLFAGLWLAAWADNFMYVGWGTLVTLGVLALLTYVVDFAATAFGAKRFGASKRAIIGAAVSRRRASARGQQAEQQRRSEKFSHKQILR